MYICIEIDLCHDYNSVSIFLIYIKSKRFNDCDTIHTTEN